MAASLVALAQSPPAIATHDGATTLASGHPAVPEDWNPAGPLAIPSIGVVPPGMEDWFDPNAKPTVRPQTSSTRAPVVAAPSALARSIEQTIPSAAATTTDTPPASAPALATTPAPTTQAPQRTEPAEGTTTPTTTTPTTTTPQTTTPQTTTPAPTTEPPAPTPTPPPAEISERGNVVLELGTPLTVLDGTEGLVLAVAVDSVTLDPTCTAPESTPAANGHLVAVHLHVTTGADLTALGAEPAIRTADFRFLATDGVTLIEVATPSADACLLDADAFPSGVLAPEQELIGTVVLDVPGTTGTLVYAPEYLTSGAEWAY